MNLTHGYNERLLERIEERISKPSTFLQFWYSPHGAASGFLKQLGL